MVDVTPAARSIASTALDAPAFERGNVVRLAVAQALAGGNAAVVYTVGAIVGATLTPAKAFATLPLTVFVIGMALSTLPAGVFARRNGRRAVFLAGTACGIVMGLLAALGIALGSFMLFCAAMLFGGAYAAVILTFRFAAADCAPPERRARAVSTVMAGGLFAGFIGPQLVSYTMDVAPTSMFAVTFLGSAVIAAVSGLVLWGVRLPGSALEQGGGGRPLPMIARQPRFVIAVLCGLTSYMLMNFVMTAAPLAMKMCGLPQSAANTGLQWHIIAMYGPGFFTGRLIARFGAPLIVVVGLALIALGTAAGLTGLAAEHFWADLILLGVGWNFGFTGASVMILDCHRPEERTRVQSLNDFIIFGTMAVGSFASGSLLTTYGWEMVCWVTLPPLALTAVALLSVRSLASRRPAAA